MSAEGYDALKVHGTHADQDAPVRQVKGQEDDWEYQPETKKNIEYDRFLKT